eukprot:5622897-Amphidinium_carterae.1
MGSGGRPSAPDVVPRPSRSRRPRSPILPPGLRRPQPPPYPPGGAAQAPAQAPTRTTPLDASGRPEETRQTHTLRPQVT